MDADYGRNRAPTTAFEPSLFVWATMMSRPAADRAIVDSGFKALVCDELAAIYERHLERARRPRPIGRHRPPRPRRQDPPRPRPSRPDRQPLRLVRLRPQQPRRAPLADHRQGCHVLTLARPTIGFSEPTHPE